jgi:hypothetical protein
MTTAPCIDVTRGLVAAVPWASRLARRHGCEVHEGSARPCIFDGADRGDTVHAALAMGWLAMSAVSLALVPVIGLVVLPARDVLP